MAQYKAHEVVYKRVAMVPEGRGVFARLTVAENLDMGAFQHKNKKPNAETRDRVFSMFPRLRERSKQQAGTLSGGEQQMLAISRSIMARPRLLLLDEPSLGLAPIVVKKIFEIIAKINEENRTTIFLVEQNANLALKVAHRGYVMETGKITLTDSAAHLLDNEQVRKAYLGM